MSVTDVTKIKDTKRKARNKQRTEIPAQPATPAHVKQIVEQMKQAANEATKDLKPKRGKERRIPVTKSEVKKSEPLDKSVAQQAYESLREDMIERHVKVTRFMCYAVTGPKGTLYVYHKQHVLPQFDKGKEWYVGTSMKSEPIGGSKMQERALTWAQNQLV